MPKIDHYGNNLSTSSGKAIGFYDEGVRHILGSNFGAVEAMQAAIDEAPDFALGHVGLARAYASAGDMKSARDAMEIAKSHSKGLTDRELSHLEANDHLLSGRGKEARQRVEQHVRDYPLDVLVAQMCTSVFGLIAFSGCAATEAQYMGFTSQLLPHYPDDDWWIKCVHAISLCENGLPERSLDLMEQSLEIHPRNATGAHFKAHALYELGETNQGYDYLDDWIVDYDRRAQIHGHLSWHLALWALAKGDLQTMWSRIDQDIRPGVNEGLAINILTDTAAILHRAELAGHAVEPERWVEISDYAARKFPNTGQSFIDAHKAIAHTMAGNGDELEKLTESPKGFAADLIPPIADAWRSMVRADWGRALECLTPVMAQTARLGGSRAQRDLLDFTYANILLKSGKSREAKRVLALRRPVIADGAPVAGLHA